MCAYSRQRWCRDMAWAFSLLVVTTPVTAAQAVGVSLDNIVDNVRQNEDLYKNIEVTMMEHYVVGDQVIPGTGNDYRIPTKIDKTLRFIRQDGKYRLEKHGIHEYSNGQTNTTIENRIVAYDGEKTRLLEQAAVGNIVVGPVDDPYFVKPHMFLLQQDRWIATLSTWLKGHDALAADPRGRSDLDPKVRLENTYQGVAVFRGLRCHEVWITLVFKSTGERGTRREMWLAEDRNYIPARVVTWSPNESKVIPSSESYVNEWREIKPGIWFPMAATCTRYDPFALQRDGTQRLQWRSEHTVKEVSLDPKHDIAFFRDVKFPDGTAVYEVDNGKITKSYRVGVPDAPGGPTPNVMGRWRTPFILSAALAILCAVFITRRIRRRTASG